MKAILTTCMGLEREVAREIRALFDRQAVVSPDDFRGRVAVDVNRHEEIIEFICSLRTVQRCMILLASFEIASEATALELISEKLRDTDVLEYIPRGCSFAVRATRNGDHEFTSLQVASKVGQAVVDMVRDARGLRQRVDLSDPDVIIKADVLDNRCMICLDLVGDRSLHRRGWRQYYHRAGIKEPIAATMVNLSEWREDEVLVDPMTGSATIPIEACHKAMGISPVYFRGDDLALVRISDDWKAKLDELRERCDSQIDWNVQVDIRGLDRHVKYLDGARQNLESAKVADKIALDQMDVRDIERTFPPESVDVIIANPPYGVRMDDRHEAEKTHVHLLSAAGHLLKPGGRLVVVTTRGNVIYDHASRFGMKLRNSFSICSGGLWMGIFKLVKS